MPANNNTAWVTQVNAMLNAMPALDTAYTWQNTAAPAVDIRRGPHAPNEWLGIIPAPDGGPDFLLKRSDNYGYEQHFMYLNEVELRGLGPLIMGWLAKRAHEGGT